MQSPFRFVRYFLLLFLLVGVAQTARAGLNFTVDLYVSGGNYVFYTPLDTNDIAPDAQYGTYTIFSPEWPTNGSWRQIVYDTNDLYTSDGAENYYTNLPLALYQITNGTWTMQFSNSITTNTYHFIVSLPGGLASNKLPVTVITSPSGDTQGLTNEPTFTWAGAPTNWGVTGSLYVFQYPTNNSSFYYSDPNPVAGAQDSFTMPYPIPAENAAPTYFNVDFVTNYASPLFIASTPTNNIGTQLGGWTYNSILESGAQLYFTVAPPPNSSTNHVLIAHYAFDNSGFLGQDSSTNGNDLDCASSWGDNQLPIFTSDAKAGDGAALFFGQSSLVPCDNEPAFEAWTNAMTGSFTVSVWIKTTNAVDGDDDQLNDSDGQNVVYQNNEGNGIIPLGLTGTKAAIETGLPPDVYGQDTLNSVNSVVTGSYVHVAVTRDAGSGQKQIYINGILDSSDYAEPGILNYYVDYASIGGELGGAYNGELDDVQIYSGVLAPSDILYLYSNPGQTATNGNVITFGDALGEPALNWTNSGDSSWFIESTNTDDGAQYAAQSGVVENDQTSTITVTINGPAYLSWNWAAQGNINDFDYEAYLDGDSYNGYIDDLYYDTSWVSDGPYPIPSGTHTVSWTAFAYGDDDPTEAGFLDQVSVTPAEVQLMNPQINGANFQFSFLAQYGFNYAVLSTTNLATGKWSTNSTFAADGQYHQISVPYKTTPQQFFTVLPQ